MATVRSQARPAPRRRFGRIGLLALIGIALYLVARPHYNAYLLERSCRGQANGHWDADKRECIFGGPRRSSAPPASDDFEQMP